MEKIWEIKEVNDVSDFKEIILLEEKAFAYPYSLELFEYDFLYHPFSKYFKLLFYEKIIGYCGLWLIDDSCQITTIAIDPSYQGQGFGKIILEYIFDYLRKQNCQDITLEVRISNTKAIKLYERFGFEIVSIRKKYYENGEDAYLMYKKL